MVRVAVELEADILLAGCTLDPFLFEGETDYAFLGRVFLVPVDVSCLAVWLLNCLLHWSGYIDRLPTAIAMAITLSQYSYCRNIEMGQEEVFHPYPNAYLKFSSLILA
jgi:hypothetical protein